MAYKVKLDIFEGPFDLLVYLIESAEMSIYDIRVSEITDQYLAYLSEARFHDLALGGEFMVLAAALIELKSKMLLPRIHADGTPDEDDPRRELVQKILEYKRFKAAAARLGEREDRAALLFEKPKEDILPYTDEPDEYLRMDMDRFIQAFRLFVGRKQRIDEVKRRYERVERQRATMESKIAFIRGLFGLKRAKTLNFREFLGAEHDRYEIVLTFVSLLEMARNKLVGVTQRANFSEITVELLGREEAGSVQ